MATFDYQRYLTSREWGIKRRQVQQRFDGYCERCGLRRARQTHHLTYRNIGNEPLDDLLAVCAPCHEYVSAQRKSDPVLRWTHLELPHKISLLRCICHFRAAQWLYHLLKRGWKDWLDRYQHQDVLEDDGDGFIQRLREEASLFPQLTRSQPVVEVSLVHKLADTLGGCRLNTGKSKYDPLGMRFECVPSGVVISGGPLSELYRWYETRHDPEEGELTLVASILPWRGFVVWARYLWEVEHRD